MFWYGQSHFLRHWWPWKCEYFVPKALCSFSNFWELVVDILREMVYHVRTFMQSRQTSARRALRWSHNEPGNCLLSRLFSRRSKETSQLCVTGLCEGNSPANYPHKGPVTRKMFPFDYFIMSMKECYGKNRINIQFIEIQKVWRLLSLCTMPWPYLITGLLVYSTVVAKRRDID